jgi:tRNA threonylcarbamoyladenosine biosynthesis protein TsaB
VGVAVAKGLVHTLGVPLWSTPVLMVMAAEARAPGTVLALGDALRGELFAAVYRWAPSRVQCDFGPTVLSPELLLDSIERPDRVVGIASHDLLQELASHWGTVLTAPPASYPRAATLLELVGIEGGAQRVTDPAGWEPEYGRPAEAQRRWEASHGRALPDSPGVAR